MNETTTSKYEINIENCPMPVLLVTSKGEIVKTNSKLDRLFEYELDELSGQLVEVLIPPEIREYHPQLRDAFFEDLVSRSMGAGRDLCAVTKTGRLLRVEIGLEPVKLNGEQMVLASVLDIQERLLAEERLRRSIDAASSGMVEVDDKGCIVMVSLRAQEMLGYREKELLGQNIEILIPAKSRRKHAVYRVSYQRKLEKRNMGEDRKLTALRKDGSQFPVEIGLTPIKGPNGNTTLATISDITERVRTEERLKENAEKLGLANKELTDFAYSASHDLKSPLTSLAGLLKFCQSDLEKGELSEVKLNLERSCQLAERLAARIEKLLSLAKTSIAPSDWEFVDLEELINSTWEGVILGNPAQIDFSARFSDQTEFRTIPALFQPIMENLLSNAIKFRRAEANSKVQIETETEAEMLQITVTDNGVGIPQDCHDRVFGLFQRFSPEVSQGSGLGLSLVKKNTTQLGGEVSFESSPGKTVFRVRLPQQTAEERQDAQ